MNAFYPSILLSLVGLTLAASVRATPVAIPVGQTVQLAPNGAAPPLALTHVANTGRTVYTAGASFEGGDMSTIGGMAGLTTTFRIAITGAPLDHVEYSTTYLADWAENYITQVRITRPGSAVVLDNATGRFTGFSNHSGGVFTAVRVAGVQTGGTFAVTNVRASTTNGLIYADIRGQSAAVGTRPAVTYSQDNVPLWTYDALNGPGALPIAALQNGGDAGAKLTGVGFRIWSVTATRITFFGLYRFTALRFTPQGLDLWHKSLGSLGMGKSGMSAINGDPIGVGELQVSTMLSIPVPAH